MQYYEVVQYLRYLEERIKALENRVHTLEQGTSQWAGDLQELKQIKPVHIENIHYKVQELAVQELSGTLNIGLSSLTSPEQLEKLVNQADKDSSAPNIYTENLSSEDGADAPPENSPAD